ncbi:MAG TPA: hypothetical protein PL124_04480 [Candidatus Cloacimonadota bacterium]|nr:hypothetical protein [Candidatus Cloacimonadota bacterium]
MNVTFDKVTTDGGLQDFDLLLDIDRTLVINSTDEKRAKAILNAIIGLDEVIAGSLTIDGKTVEEYIGDQPVVSVFGYVFDEGIMLSNLTLRENLLLPYRMIRDKTADDNFDEEIVAWFKFFKLEADLDSRPDFVNPALLKILGFIRPLLFSPELLLIDNPYYLLSQEQRKAVLNALNQLRKDHKMLILSTDDDFTKGFADRTLTL